ncbi:MAG: menaquinone biosynthesis protein [Bacteroidota bacterium]|nr:menaquinone biosynthesis protein [Bacteroidota bacterium]
MFYNPLKIHGENLIGKIPYLNSVPVYRYLDSEDFKILPVTPRRLGVLFKQGTVVAGLVSLMDYFDQEENLDIMNWCIAARDQVQSVLLFSKYEWKNLAGKTIGVIDDTSTSVKLLEVILKEKYGVSASLERMKPNDYQNYSAVILIGDEALKSMKSGIPGFNFRYDLATEWFVWQKVPFVFAVFAVSKSLSQDSKNLIQYSINESLTNAMNNLEVIGSNHGRTLGYTSKETKEYLEEFNYVLGEREREAIRVFREMVANLEQTPVGSK